MRIYVDLFAAVNFFVDLLLLTGTNRLAGYPAGVGRASLGAALGGIYGCACLMPGFRFLGNLLWRGVSLALMGLLAFGGGPGTLRRCILFVFLSMALGGIAMALGTGGFWTLVGSAGLVLAMCILGFGGVAGQRRYVPVMLKYGTKTVELMALHDTGNTLRDPVTGERILVAGADTAEKLLGLDAASIQNPAGTVALAPIPGLRLIPYSAVGKKGGLLLGIRVRDARINGKKESLLVAFAPEGLGAETGETEALIGGMV